jgi:hypothetical protein
MLPMHPYRETMALLLESNRKATDRYDTTTEKLQYPYGSSMVELW